MEDTQNTSNVEHKHVGGSAGGPGENSAECACGVTYDGFDTHAEATALLDKHIADARAQARRAEYIAGLRALADILERRPELVLPFDGNTTGLSVFVTNDPHQREQLAAWSRALPGKKSKHETGKNGELFRVSGNLHGLKVHVVADRDEVCERVVTGTREVTKTVPDPEALAAVPTVEVTETVEDVEWRCGPLLAVES